MQTVTIEIARQGTGAEHALNPAATYIARCDDQPQVDISINCEQPAFEQYKEKLRYTDPDPAVTRQALEKMQVLVTKIFDDIPSFAIVANRKKEEWLHVRLVTAAMELIQLPFELALAPRGFESEHFNFFLLNPRRLATLTRELRQAGEPDYTWPSSPRILFAWANPLEEVPQEQHFEVLRDLVKQLVPPIPDNAEPVPDIGVKLTVVKKASLEAINAVITGAVNEGRPFTHIHLLAHGTRSSENGVPETFNLLLHDARDPAKAFEASGTALARAIIESSGKETAIPAVVSLMACDSANTGSISLPAGSVAYQLHASGIPCVFASQFPLSVAGSVTLLSALYSALLLEGEDPRKALYATRKLIAGNQSHDWASLIAYTRFPTTIDDQLKDYRLHVYLGALDISNRWAEHVLRYREQLSLQKFEAVLDDVADRLEKAINALTRIFGPIVDRKLEIDRYAEHAGLLGSACKRQAEHFFRLAGFRQEQQLSLRRKSDDALVAARDWYQLGFRKHMANHWTAIQYLSLDMVLKGQLDEEAKEIWTQAKFLAKSSETADNPPKDQIWAWGTLVELYLVRPMMVTPDNFENELNTSLPIAKSYAEKLARAKGSFLGNTQIAREEITFAVDSTRRQVERYCSWFPVINPSPAMMRLKESAGEILQVLR